MIEVVVVTAGGEVSETCPYGNPRALVTTIDRLAVCVAGAEIVEWFVRPARGYRWG